MARVTSPEGHTTTIKGKNPLNWFTHKLRTDPLRSVVLTKVGRKKVMEAVFEDDYIFVTVFPSMYAFEYSLGRQLEGQMVAVVDGNEVREFTLGSKS